MATVQVDLVCTLSFRFSCCFSIEAFLAFMGEENAVLLKPSLPLTHQHTCWQMQFSMERAGGVQPGVGCDPRTEDVVFLLFYGVFDSVK